MTAFIPTANTAIIVANSSGVTSSVTTSGGSGYLLTNIDQGNIVFVNIGGSASLPNVNVTTTTLANTASSNATTKILTLTFADPGSVPYVANSYISLSGFTPNTYNTTSARVLSGSNTQITVSTTGTGNITVLGNISQTINNSKDVVIVLPRSSLLVGSSPVTNSPGNIVIGCITSSGTANIYVTPGQ